MFFKRVIPGHPDVCILRVVYFWLLNAQIVCTTNWTSTQKLYFSSAAAAWLTSRCSWHGASFGTLTCRSLVWDARRRGRHHSPFCWRRSCWCLRRGWLRRPPSGSVQTKPRSTVQAHDVAIEVAQHFEKIVVKSVFGEGCFRRDCRRDTKSSLQRPHDHSSFFEPCALIV